MTARSAARTASIQRSWLRSTELIVWALFLISIPYYVGRSGVPQPSTILAGVLAMVEVTRPRRRLPVGYVRVLRPLFAFVVWTFAVNLGWALIEGKWQINSYVIYALYYAYNAVIFMFVLVMYNRHGERALIATVDALFVSIGTLCIASLVVRSTDLRARLFFNNPNQLGYYALLVACTVALTQGRLRLSLVKVSAVMLGCAYLALLSASRAAVGGVLILFALLVISNRRVLLFSIAVVIALLALFGDRLTPTVAATEERIEYRRTEDVITKRNYDRLWRYWEYDVVGAGEGDLGRFTDDPKHAVEIHSTPGTIVFSYGVVGVILFLAFATRVLRGGRLGAWLAVTPAALYEIAHQGLRFTMVWILFALFAAIKVPAAPDAGAPPSS